MKNNNLKKTLMENVFLFIFIFFYLFFKNRLNYDFKVIINKILIKRNNK